MQVYIMAGGPADCHPVQHIFEGIDVTWAAVDRGVYHLLKKGIIPQAAFGDYDSVTKQELEWMQQQIGQLHIVPSEKDETDLELALNWALEQKPDSILIFGATGGRLDHELANIQMLLKGVEEQIEIAIVDHKNEIRMKKAGSYQITKSENFPYISFLPVTDKVKDITLRGFKYPLTNRTIEQGSTLCISNELAEEKGTFSFSSGILMVIRSTD